MERETGIEPASSAWKAEVLPLNYSRAERVCPAKSCLSLLAAIAAEALDGASLLPILRTTR